MCASAAVFVTVFEGTPFTTSRVVQLGKSTSYIQVTLIVVEQDVVNLGRAEPFRPASARLTAKF